MDDDGFIGLGHHTHFFTEQKKLANILHINNNKKYLAMFVYFQLPCSRKYRLVFVYFILDFFLSSARKKKIRPETSRVSAFWDFSDCTYWRYWNAKTRRPKTVWQLSIKKWSNETEWQHRSVCEIRVEFLDQFCDNYSNVIHIKHIYNVTAEHGTRS